VVDILEVDVVEVLLEVVAVELLAEVDAVDSVVEVPIVGLPVGRGVDVVEVRMVGRGVIFVVSVGPRVGRGVVVFLCPSQLACSGSALHLPSSSHLYSTSDTVSLQMKLQTVHGWTYDPMDTGSGWQLHSPTSGRPGQVISTGGTKLF